METHNARRVNIKQILREVVIWSAFAASGGHIYQVAVDMGNHPAIAAVHAVGIDGLVYIGIIAYSTGAKVRGALAVVYGGAVSLAFNAAAYSTTGQLPVWVMAMSMPVSLVLGVLVGHGVVTEADPAPLPIPVQPAPEVHPVPPPQPVEPEHVTPGPAAEPPAAPKPDAQRRSQAVHRRADRTLSGPELKADAVALVRAEGLSNADLAQRYTPPLQPWRAREFVSEARKPVNGHAPVGTLS